MIRRAMLLASPSLFFLVWAQSILPPVYSMAQPRHGAHDSGRAQEQSCNVRAWIRAEDLQPDSISNGDLRIKVDPSCSVEVSSVTLQLQLDEYAEVKFPKKGAAMPIPPAPSNTSRWLNWYGSDSKTDQYRNDFRDPSLWEIFAEERTAWKSALTLHEGPFDYTRPLVVPFAVAMPHVQFPPGLESPAIFLDMDDQKYVTHSRHAYRYSARVTFSDGHSIEVPAGFTTFHPLISTSAAVHQASSVNVTFSSDTCRDPVDWMGNCSSIWSSETSPAVYTAQIDLEAGDVIHAGNVLKGKMIFSEPTSSIHQVNAFVESGKNQRWAQARAKSGGDSNAFQPGSCFTGDYIHQEISVSACNYGHIFDDKNACAFQGHDFNTQIRGASSVDFQLRIDENASRNFHMHYADLQSFLTVTLHIPYPQAIQQCLLASRGDEQLSTNDNEDPMEEGLWDTWTPVGQESLGHMYTYELSAKVPITILGPEDPNPSSQSEAPIHYLDPRGVLSPVLLSAAPPSIEDVIFPIAQPIISVQAKEKTIERMLAPFGEEPWSIPQDEYHSGNYAGLLWKKKTMAGTKSNSPASSDYDELSRKQATFTVAL